MPAATILTGMAAIIMQMAEIEEAQSAACLWRIDRKTDCAEKGCK
jgi:hypothetical protein